MNAITHYMIEHQDELSACKKYISDGTILVIKEMTKCRLLKAFTTMEEDQLEINHIEIKKAGDNLAPIIMPGYVVMEEDEKLYYKIENKLGEKFLFPYEAIELFRNSVIPVYDLEYYVSRKGSQSPVMQIFMADEFLGLIVGIER